MMGPEVADAARRISAQLKAAWYRLTIPPFSPCLAVSLDALANAPWSGRLFALEVH